MLPNRLINYVVREESMMNRTKITLTTTLTILAIGIIVSSSTAIANPALAKPAGSIYDSRI